MKVAVSGKGGVGKTTFAAGLGRAWQRAGRRVLCVDADPDSNLAGTLGHRGPEPAPLAEWKKLVEERVGAQGGWGGFLKMNPRVDDIPERLSVDVGGIRVLRMGHIERGRRGCACPENVLLREVLHHLLLLDDEHVVVDMEAGVEHLGRGTAEAVDAMIVVVEPGWAALATAERVAKLARELGIRRIEAVANKVSSAEDSAFVREHLGGLTLLGALPFDRGLEAEARDGTLAADRPYHRELERIALALEQS